MRRVARVRESSVFMVPNYTFRLVSKEGQESLGGFSTVRGSGWPLLNDKQSVASYGESSGGHPLPRTVLNNFPTVGRRLRWKIFKNGGLYSQEQ